jgi:hypothetical protein
VCVCVFVLVPQLTYIRWWGVFPPSGNWGPVCSKPPPEDGDAKAGGGGRDNGGGGGCNLSSSFPPLPLHAGSVDPETHPAGELPLGWAFGSVEETITRHIKPLGPTTLIMNTYFWGGSLIMSAGLFPLSLSPSLSLPLFLPVSLSLSLALSRSLFLSLSHTHTLPLGLSLSLSLSLCVCVCACVCLCVYVCDCTRARASPYATRLLL